MRYSIALVLSIIAASVQAAPFLSCAVYPPSGTQPTEFLVKMDADVEVSVPAVDSAAGQAPGKRLLHDLGLLGFGKHTAVVKAKAGSIVSAPATLPFQIGIVTPELIVIP